LLSIAIMLSVIVIVFTVRHEDEHDLLSKFQATSFGTLDIDEVARSASDCHSGKLAKGTNRCAPDQFRVCLSSAGVPVTFWAGSRFSGTRLTGSDKCVLSDPSSGETAATGVGEMFGSCRQFTFWELDGVPCWWRAPNYLATWDRGRIY
jgi:hypothetical protein